MKLHQFVFSITLLKNIDSLVDHSPFTVYLLEVQKENIFQAMHVFGFARFPQPCCFQIQNFQAEEYA